MVKALPIYQLTSDHIFYYNGEAMLFKRGQKFSLAGLELSKHTNNSPFHFQREIIRLPNSILEKVND